MSGPRGDGGFERLYQQHHGAVYRYVLGRVRDSHDAEDVTQAAFLEAFRALRRGNVPARPRPWLLAIAQNVVRRRHRGDRIAEVPLSEAADAGSAEVEATAAEIKAALDRLPPAQREVFLLREVHGRHAAETAEQLGVSTAAVEMLLFRARRAFRAHFDAMRSRTLPSILVGLRAIVGDSTSAVHLDGVQAAAAAAVIALVVGSAGGASHPVTGNRGPDAWRGAGVLLGNDARTGGDIAREQKQAPPRAIDADRDDGGPVVAQTLRPDGLRPTTTETQAEERNEPTQPAPAHSSPPSLPLQSPLPLPAVPAAPTLTVPAVTTPTVPGVVP